MDKTYIEFVCETIRQADVGMPIYTKRIAPILAKNTELDETAAAAAVAVAMKRIQERVLIPELRMYQKGIYYRSAQTVFGEVGINKEQLIADKYLLPNKGYETGLAILHQMGLTTQMPKERVLATNEVKECARTDKKLNVVIRPPKILINNRNKGYLQTLDVLEMLDQAPIDTANPHLAIDTHIRNKGLRYDVLLALADQYYNRQTVLHLAHTAKEGGVTP